MIARPTASAAAAAAVIAAVIAVAVAVIAAAASVPGNAAASARPGPAVAWVGTWEAAPVAPAATGLSHTGFRDVTVRDIVHLSAGGSEIRVRLSNVFGTRPLTIGDVRVAVSGRGPRTAGGRGHQVTFSGRAAVTIGVGKREFSDPVKLAVGAGQDLAVSIFLKPATGPATWHPAALATSYYSAAGDHSAAGGTAAYPHAISAWYFLDGVDVVNTSLLGAVVTFGASTTDGVGSVANANGRYSDDLARRLLGRPGGRRMSVLNAGVSGNQLLVGHGASGESALRRFYRDAIDQSGVRAIVIWEGSNDIGNHPAIRASQLIDAYRQLIAEAGDYGIPVIGATLQPDQGAAYYTLHGNQVRETVNRWIAASGQFDAVLNFDAVLRDPRDPAELLPAYDSGDHLHPNGAGYQAIADSIAPKTVERLITG